MKKFNKVFGYILAGVGLLASGAASSACVIFIMDEPEMSLEMIEN